MMWRLLIVLLGLGSCPTARLCAQTWSLLNRSNSEEHWGMFNGSALTSSGDVVVVGGALGPVRFDPGYRIGQPGTSTAFVTRYAPGTQRWRWLTQLSNGPGVRLYNVLTLPDDDLLVMGIFQGPVGFSPLISTAAPQGVYDGYVARLDGATGAWRWVAPLLTAEPNAHAAPSGFTLCPDGSVAVVGRFNGRVRLGGLPLLVAPRPSTFGNNFDVFVARLAPATGQWQQALSFGGAADDAGTDVVALPDGRLVVAGSLQTPFSLGPLPPLRDAAGVAFAACLQPATGQWQWLSTVRADTAADGQRLALLPDGDVVFSGRYQGGARCGTLTLARGRGRCSSFVGRLRSADGQWQWVSSGAGTTRPMGRGALATTPSGDVVMYSAFSGRGQFGPFPEVQSVSANPDLFLGQLNGDTGRWQWLSTAGGNGGSNPYSLADDDYPGALHVLGPNRLLVSGSFSQQARLGPNVGPLSTRTYDGFLASVSTPVICTDTAANGATPGLRIVPDSSYCGPEPALLVLGAPAGSTIRWNTGATGPQLLAPGPGQYSAVVHAPTECRYQLRYQLAPPTPVALPNVITPNGDGVNDTWVVPGLPVATRAQIFNRWGRQVFQTDAYRHDWAAPGLPAGIYYYRLDKRQPCANRHWQGWVEVVR